MTILVTGGGGLLGSRVVRKLLAIGQTVVSLDTGSNQRRLADLENCDNLKIIHCDICESERLAELLKSLPIESVIHLAAVLAPISENKPAFGFSVNIQGSANVFEAASVADVRRVIYASSIAVFDDQIEYGRSNTVDEFSLRKPYSLYGYAKLINEETANSYNKNSGLVACGLRIPAIFGHGRTTGRSSAISRIISEAAVGRPTVSDVASDQAAPIIYVDDAADCFIKACLADKVEEPIFCLPNYLITVEEAVAAIQSEIPGAEITFSHDAAHYKSVLNIDSHRFESTYDYKLPEFKTRVVNQINEARQDEEFNQLLRR